MTIVGETPEPEAVPAGTGLAAGSNADPLWRRAADAIAAEIRGGRYKAGDRLPAERELCEQFDISRVTLRRALQSLVDDGLVSSSHGRGWFVGTPERARGDWPTTLESFTETAERMGLVTTSRVIRHEIVPASFDEAERFGIAPGSAIVHLDRVRLLSDVPIGLDSSILPADLAPGIESVDFTLHSLYTVLANAGVDPARAESTIEAKPASAELAGLLDIREHTPTLVLKQIVTDHDDRIVLTSTIQYAGERYRLRTSFSRPGPSADF
jgi:GntR family transcriptional regulator